MGAMAAKREGLKAASSQVPNAPVLPGPGQWLALNHLIESMTCLESQIEWP